MPEGTALPTKPQKSMFATIESSLRNNDDASIFYCINYSTWLKKKKSRRDLSQEAEQEWTRWASGFELRASGCKLRALSSNRTLLNTSHELILLWAGVLGLKLKPFSAFQIFLMSLSKHPLMFDKCSTLVRNLLLLKSRDWEKAQKLFVKLSRK